jgi:Ca2+-binding RTX toxin-like protein
MTSASARRIAVPIAMGLLALLCASSASAATSNPFGCRASSARVTLLNSAALTVEPITANPSTTPCATDNHGLDSVSVPSSNKLLDAGPAAAFTFSSTSQDATTGAVAPGAAALASIDGVTIPTSQGAITIVGPVEASASYVCSNGTLTAASHSTLDLLKVGNQEIALPSPGASMTIPLGNLGYIAVNEKIQTANSITERVLDVHLNGIADVVVDEAKVTVTGNDPCAGSTGPVTPPATNPCPSGTTYDAALQACVIVIGGKTIIVSAPFQGPTGGKVLAVTVARKRFKSPCLSGAGPAFVIVGTKHHDRINGTRKSDRILALGGNDRVSGQGGADCIDGGGGNDRIWAGKGDSRIYGRTGNDRVAAQDGNSKVWLGAGHDLAFLGNGNVTVYGGRGADRIGVGRGHDHVYGGPGNDRISVVDGFGDRVYGGAGADKIWIGLGQAQVWGGAGADRIWSRSEAVSFNCGGGFDLAYLTSIGKPFAATHSCDRIRLVKPIKSGEHLHVH